MTDPTIIEGRRLFQRMITLATHDRHDDSTAEMFKITDVRVILAALNIAVYALAGVIDEAMPTKEARTKFLNRKFLEMEATE